MARAARGCARLSMTPLPIMVSQKGMRISSTNWRSMLDVSLRFAPAPMTNSGWVQAWAAEEEKKMSVACSLQHLLTVCLSMLVNTAKELGTQHNKLFKSVYPSDDNS